MQRPQSIVLFERCYLGAWAIGLANTALNWSSVRADPRVAQASAMVGSWYMPTITAIGMLIPLVLWYFIARRGSVVAKWIMVVLTALGFAGLAFSVLTGRFPMVPRQLLSVVAVALNVFAATLLFRRDAKRWFGEGAA